MPQFTTHFFSLAAILPCAHTAIFTRIWTHTYVHICIHLVLHTYVYKYTCAYMYIHIPPFVDFVLMLSYGCICIIFTHIYAHKYTHVCRFGLAFAAILPFVGLAIFTHTYTNIYRNLWIFATHAALLLLVNCRLGFVIRMYTSNIHTYVHCTYICLDFALYLPAFAPVSMGWLRLVGSIKT